MKKIIIFISSFLLVGCTTSISNTLSIDEAVNEVLIKNKDITNTSGKGFKYYKPRDFSILEDNTYNQVLLNDGDKYYLNLDINGYYNKIKEEPKIDSSLFYSKIFSHNNINGYVEIRQRNSYFYIKMMYNYSYIEVSVEESYLKQAVINSIIILSSIKYNDKVIENLISTGDLNSKESTYEIKKPENSEQNNNLLNVFEHDNN